MVERQQLSRRKLLLGVAATGALAMPLPTYELTSLFKKEYQTISNFNNDWEEGSHEPSEFYKRNEHRLSHLAIGTSFAPEHFGVTLEQLDAKSSHFQEKEDEAMRALDFIINDLGIRDIRLGIRWNNTQLDDDHFDPSIYRPYLEKCFQNKVDLTLDVGPIKTQRWPEVHVPEMILRELPDLPPTGAVISSKSELARAGLSHLTNLFTWIKDNYPDDLGTIKRIQPENEGLGKFGPKKWQMGEEYLKSVINLIHDEFSDCEILLNSAGGSNLSQIRRITHDLDATNPDLAGKIVSGINYYYNKTDSRVFPFLNSKDSKADPIFIAKISTPFSQDEFSKHMKESKDMGMPVEITEGQAERWTNDILYPEISRRGFQTMLLRTAPYTHKVNRIWGSENLFKNVSYGREEGPVQMAEIIRKINGNTPRALLF